MASCCGSWWQLILLGVFLVIFLRVRRTVCTTEEDLLMVRFTLVPVPISELPGMMMQVDALMEKVALVSAYASERGGHRTIVRIMITTLGP